MKKPTLTEIKNFIERTGGTYEKAKCYLNGQPAYRVSGKLMTKDDMVARYMEGLL